MADDLVTPELEALAAKLIEEEDPWNVVHTQLRAVRTPSALIGPPTTGDALLLTLRGTLHQAIHAEQVLMARAPSTGHRDMCGSHLMALVQLRNRLRAQGVDV